MVSMTSHRRLLFVLLACTMLAGIKGKSRSASSMGCSLYGEIWCLFPSSTSANSTWSMIATCFWLRAASWVFPVMVPSSFCFSHPMLSVGSDDLGLQVAKPQQDCQPSHRRQSDSTGGAQGNMRRARGVSGGSLDTTPPTQHSSFEPRKTFRAWNSSHKPFSGCGEPCTSVGI